MFAWIIVVALVVVLAISVFCFAIVTADNSRHHIAQMNKMKELNRKIRESEAFWRSEYKKLVRQVRETASAAFAGRDGGGK